MGEKELSTELIQALLKYIKNMDIDGAVLISMPGWNMIYILMKHLLQHPIFVNVDKGLGYKYPRNIARSLEARYFNLFPWVPRPFELYLVTTLSRLSCINFFRRHLLQPSSALTQNHITHFNAENGSEFFYGGDLMGLTHGIGRALVIKNDELLRIQTHEPTRGSLFVSPLITSKRIPDIRPSYNMFDINNVTPIRSFSSDLVPVRPNFQCATAAFQPDYRRHEVALSWSAMWDCRLIRRDESESYLKLIFGILAAKFKARSYKPTVVIIDPSSFSVIRSVQRHMENTRIATHLATQIWKIRSFDAVSEASRLTQEATSEARLIQEATSEARLIQDFPNADNTPEEICPAPPIPGSSQLREKKKQMKKKEGRQEKGEKKSEKEGEERGGEGKQKLKAKNTEKKKGKKGKILDTEKN